MKKTIKTAMLSLAVLAASFGGVKAYNAYNVKNIADANLLFVENLSALSEDTETKYIRTPGDCSVEATAGTKVTLMFGNLEITSVKANVDGSVVFKDVQVSCSAGGQTMCKPRDCADFWIDVADATSGNKDDKGGNNKNSNSQTGQTSTTDNKTKTSDTSSNNGTKKS